MTLNQNIISYKIIPHETDYVVDITLEQKNTPPLNRAFSVEKTECPQSYAVLLTLTEFIEEHVGSNLIITFHMNDLFVYNVLHEYLSAWQKNNWIMSRGKPVAYVDILQGLHNALSLKHISYTCVYIK
jgi:hypothetical protein